MSELKLNDKGETGCCPRFNPTPWQKKEINWQTKHLPKKLRKAWKDWQLQRLPKKFKLILSR